LRLDPSKAHEALVSLQEKTKKLQFQKAQKEFQSALSKFGKEVDRVKCDEEKRTIFLFYFVTKAKHE
jgi:hypothetical protein